VRWRNPCWRKQYDVMSLTPKFTPLTPKFTPLTLLTPLTPLTSLTSRHVTTTSLTSVLLVVGLSGAEEEAVMLTSAPVDLVLNVYEDRWLVDQTKDVVSPGLFRVNK
jgi:hypothetical protein